MVDTYLLPEVHVVVTQVPGVDGTPTTARLTQIENDIAALMGRPVIDEMTDIPDVVGEPSNGQVLVWNEDDDQWQPMSIGSMLSAISWGGNPVQHGIRIMNFIQGLDISATTLAGLPGLNVRVIFAGTGGANSAARSDHTHAVPANTRALFNASGTLSSGTRTLVSGTVTGLDPDRTYLVDAMLIGDLRGEGTGAGYTQARIILNGITQTRLSGNGQIRTVAGVDREYAMQHSGTYVSGVSSLAYSATLAYESGDPINVGAGELVIRLRPNR